MKDFKINFVKLNPNAQTPTQAKDGDAGYDLYAAEPAVIEPLSRIVVKTGIAVEIPKGCYGRIAPRSGLAVKSGIDVMAGVIDCGYRNELGVVLINLNTRQWLESVLNSLVAPKTTFSNVFSPLGQFRVNVGDKIAQLIIEKCHSVEWNLVESLSDSERGLGGFGSTGN
jgi:dUTP pyrophosphatase